MVRPTAPCELSTAGTPPGHKYVRTAGRAHRPGSRRLGGVEAAGASLATARQPQPTWAANHAPPANHANHIAHRQPTRFLCWIYQSAGSCSAAARPSPPLPLCAATPLASSRASSPRPSPVFAAAMPRSACTASFLRPPYSARPSAACHRHRRFSPSPIFLVLRRPSTDPHLPRRYRELCCYSISSRPGPEQIFARSVPFSPSLCPRLLFLLAGFFFLA